MFWDPGRNHIAWNQSAYALETGRFEFPRSRHQLEKYAERFGLDRKLIRDEKAFLRIRLLPPSEVENRRSRLLEYIRKHRWGRLDEYDILVKAARRGRDGKRQATSLERCAAAVVALEEFRTATHVMLSAFRARIQRTGHPESPEIITGVCAQSVCDDVNRAHRILLRHVRSGEFINVFSDFLMADCRTGQGVVAWLRYLLSVHREEMAKRRTPRWFIPAGGDKWIVDVSVIGPSSAEETPAPYSYRTSNLLRMAREVGCQV